ncbi:hypothetical protein Deipr_2469 (plasmid) [Deinococcus proteolyticus MRP]|uniref:Tyrosine specific protein phosphatases domain-containing protein n=1 Tax=Deinococcus proteolyticus (strain ATCC 35074 / DSM 20540 / JCM 6276 / NBRC 101906 / NCIMB 13154 / VKM Ac-1939 / CCM 2703 / MRP) TaxID=693977 RepID=F0RQM7_DEIPM|nr:hypothetical protein [Deinococcus proteolyticus]ADY27586.1 hypothetical protein Deipr_2469 [Deinococcus proteolyticus MRP]
MTISFSALFRRKRAVTAAPDPDPAPLPRITVGSWLTAYPEEILSPGENPHLHLLVSIGEPGGVPPGWLKGVTTERTLRLEFSDDPLSPFHMTELQLARLLKEAEQLKKKQDGGPLRVHVHCMAGVSRSTACAAALLAFLHPELSDQEVLTRIQAAQPAMQPNGLVLRRADDALGRELLWTWQRMEAAAATLENQPDQQAR